MAQWMALSYGTMDGGELWHSGWRRVTAQWMAESYGTVDSAKLWHMGAGMQRCKKPCRYKLGFCFVCLSGLIVQHHKPECPVEKWDYCIQGQGHSEGSNCQ